MTAPLNYDQATRYLDGFVNFERIPPDQQARKEQLTLDRIEWLLHQVGDPHSELPAVHVAGTKGKGSVAAMVESISRAAGLTTGLYTSPHLVDLRERIRISGRRITPDAFACQMTRLHDHLEAVRDRRDTRRPTYFEIMTHVAFLQFVESAVEMAAVEVGMGGRLDATNVLSPVVCAITNISMDHTRQLGDTLAEIAGEKAGIVKPGTPVVVSPNAPEALAAITAAADLCGAPVLLIGDDIRLDEASRPAHGFAVTTPTARFDNLTVALSGHHQRQNAAVAVAAAEIFFEDTGRELPADAVREGLASLQWPGRLEKVAESPLVVLDGAHNGASIVAALAGLREEYSPERIVVLFGAAVEKDIPAMVRAVLDGADTMILTESGNPRQGLLSEVESAVRSSSAGRELATIPDIDEAIKAARDEAGEAGAVLVTGSLYLVGRTMSAMGVSAAAEESSPAT